AGCGRAGEPGRRDAHRTRAPRLRLLRTRPCAPVRARRGAVLAMSPAMSPAMRGVTVTLDANKALIRHVFETVIPAGDPAGLRELVAPEDRKSTRLNSSH